MRHRGAKQAEGGARYRIAEVSQKTGIPRETIHFYLRKGLLPRPIKGGATVSFYGDEHIERLKLIRRLREEKYLPLAVIGRLVDGGTASTERDVQVLADLLRIDPSLSEEGATKPSAEAALAAQTRGILRSEPSYADARVLTLVDEALALDASARDLTLSDLSYCAEDLRHLVEREAALFFDRVLCTSDVPSALEALRVGRGTVARFITAYRDRLLRGIVDDLARALGDARFLAENARDFRLSEGDAGEPGSPFGAFIRADLTTLGGFAEHADPTVASLGAWALCVAETISLEAFTRIATERGSALGAVLLGEVLLARTVFRGEPHAGLIDGAVRALSYVVNAEPAREANADARALAAYRRGRVELALPPVLGRLARARTMLQEGVVQASAASAAVRAFIEANTALALGRSLAAEGSREEARIWLQKAVSLDPNGPLGGASQQALSEMESHA